MVQPIKPVVLPAWAEAGDKIQPTDAELQVGWPVSSTPPARQRFNWVLNYVMNGIRYLTRRGLPDYHASETYMIGDRVIGDDGKTYKSLVDNNIAQTPSTQPTKWELWGYAKTDLNAAIKASGVQHTGPVVVSATGAITAANAIGNLVIASGNGAAITVTLPASASCPPGGTISFLNASAYDMTISRVGADVINPNNTPVNTIILKPGDTLSLSLFTTVWECFGGSAQLPYQRAMGNYLGVVSVSGATALTQAQSGSLVFASGTGYDVTLPPPASNLKVTIYTGSADSAVRAVPAAGGGLIYNGGTSAASFTLPSNATVEFVCLGNDWIVTLGGLGQASLGTSGFVKMPDGLIIQWGLSTATVAGTANTFPVAFPNAAYVVINSEANGNAGLTNVSNSAPTTSGFTAYSSVGPVSCSYVAFGK